MASRIHRLRRRPQLRPQLRLRPLALAHAITLLACAGCAIAPPAVDAGADVSAAVGLADAVAFRTESGPLDEPLGSAQLSAALAVRRAVETSAALQAALARVQVAAQEADLAGRLPNPILSLVFREPSGSGSTQVEAGLSMDLLALLQRDERARVAGQRLHAEAAAALSTALDLVADVQTLYAECQVLEQLAPVLEAQAATFDRLVEVARVRLELGAASRHELVAIEARRAESSLEAAQQRQELRLARLALARRIGEPSSAAAWTLDAWAPPPAVPTDEARWIESALATRPELAALASEVAARQIEEGLASGLPWDGAAVGLEGQDEDEWSWGPGLETPLPLFDTPDGRRARAAAHTAEARHRLTEAQRAIVEDVRSALALLQSAQEGLARIATELLPSQERRRAEVEAAFEAGQIDVTALLRADEDLARAQASRLAREREVVTALHRLERAVGGPARFQALTGADSPAASATSATSAASATSASAASVGGHEDR